ncbi:hypothetical protein P3T76_008880 [Phytophthora citrophthora]|uniref:Uncharacterized protein n=1 Tax=Phytophthora citrophthora TaxID=4793 RepID=A0AAD9GI27_9STRA|nr:hypothetical protein P3T76_008880 [Phytophthora citrophthora]
MKEPTNGNPAANVFVTQQPQIPGTVSPDARDRKSEPHSIQLLTEKIPMSEAVAKCEPELVDQHPFRRPTMMNLLKTLAQAHVSLITPRALKRISTEQHGNNDSQNSKRWSENFVASPTKRTKNLTDTCSPDEDDVVLIVLYPDSRDSHESSRTKQ